MDEGTQKINIFENMFKSTLKEMDEQKKINKSFSLKMDLCLKHFQTSAQDNMKNDQDVFFYILEETFVNQIKNIHLLK